MPTLIGTAHFVSRYHALKYYRPYNEKGTNAAEVTLREKEGAIYYGPPKTVKGEKLVIDADGRYFFSEPNEAEEE
jgi:hypothetical protein